MSEILILIVGLAAAIRGAEWVGSASIKIAKQLNISQFVIGATLVSLATTLPELSTAVYSGVAKAQPSLALGTVLGSPLFNLGFILGAIFLFTDLRPSLGYYSRSVNLLLAITFILFVTSFYQPIGSSLSIILIVFGICFLFLEFIISKHSIGWVQETSSRFESFLNIFKKDTGKIVLFEFVLGTILLLLGSKYVVDAALSLSNFWGVSQLVISITIIALGTSVPELISALISVIRKRENLALGTVVGASVVDITLGVGLATLRDVEKIAFPNNLFIFLPLFIISFLCLTVLLKWIPNKLIGGLLILTATASLALITLNQFISLL